MSSSVILSEAKNLKGRVLSRPFLCAQKNFGKKDNFRVKNILHCRPIDRQSIVFISGKRNQYGRRQVAYIQM